STFWPDPEIFDDTVYDYGTLQHRLREMAFLNKGVKITLADEREGKKQKEVFHYEGGLKEFVKHLNTNKNVLHPEVIYFEVAKKDME
ncbi:DNA topoisomerase IV subunit B, partial [Acinetobacter sp. 163]|nr:DNA topoisomerase IV subunit B [Acinetobacter sp. 163]